MVNSLGLGLSLSKLSNAMNGSDMQTYDTIRTNCFCDAGETARCRKGRKLEAISRHIASSSKWGSLPVY